MGTIDADAHVIETEETWTHILPEDKKFSPIAMKDRWVRTKNDPTSCKVIPTTTAQKPNHLTCKDINISNGFYPGMTTWMKVPTGIRDKISLFGYNNTDSCT